MRHLSYRKFAAVLMVMLTFTLCIIKSPILAQTGGGGEETHNWAISLPFPDQDITRTSSVPGFGEAGKKNDAYLFTVFYDGGNKSSSGMSSSNYTWAAEVDPPAGLGNKWPIGTGLVILFAEFETQDWVSVDFVN